MRDGMTLIKTFTSETEAQLALNHLKAMGLAAMIEKDNAGGMYAQLDLTHGVKLLVSDQDREQALALLADSAEKPVTAPWTCGSCGEKVETSFDTCWKCGVARS